MGEPQIITFSYKEIAEMMVKNEGIHEGLWGLTMEMAFRASNIKMGPSDDDVVLGAIIPIVKIGIQKFNKPNPLTIDAAKVNPPPKTNP